MAVQSDVEANQYTLKACVESMTAVTNLSNRLQSRTNEVQHLNSQLALLQRMYKDARAEISVLKTENKELKRKATVMFRFGVLCYTPIYGISKFFGIANDEKVKVGSRRSDHGGGTPHGVRRWSCESDPEARGAAEFSPGLVTLDGHADDWKNVAGFEFSLLPALDPHPNHEYKGGKMIVKALHDGKDVYFMLQIDGDYVYSKGDGTKCPSVALMFQVGESATYHDMCGCKESPNSASCHGYVLKNSSGQRRQGCRPAARRKKKTYRPKSYCSDTM
ncbi:hypothetical protein CsSME_00020339 [Camellia sinensis var. sinensis]